MKLYRPKPLALLCAAGALALVSCGSSHVTAGKAIYYPSAQLQRVSNESAQPDLYGWQSPDSDNDYVAVTNLLNGKKVRAQILMKRTSENGTVTISISKKTAEALGMVYTGLAPVEIKYKRTL